MPTIPKSKRGAKKLGEKYSAGHVECKLFFRIRANDISILSFFFAFHLLYLP